MAVSTHRLNILAAIFLPLATISSVLGMNLRHGWENADPPAFWVAVGIGAFAGLMLTVLVANRPAPPLERASRQKRTKRR
jgi:Mg2+ and Co2+ transporter CorA